MANVQWHLLFDSTASLKSSLIENRVGRKQLGNRSFCIVFSNGELYAFDEQCPHAYKSLFGGICEANHVVCPIHKFKFNLATGKGHGLSLQIHPIKREGDQYYISFKG